MNRLYKYAFPGAAALLLALTPVICVSAQPDSSTSEARAIEAAYDKIDEQIFTMRAFADDAAKVGGTLYSLARAVEDAEALEPKLVALRSRIAGLHAGTQEEDKAADEEEGTATDGEGEDWNAFLDSLGGEEGAGDEIPEDVTDSIDMPATDNAGDTTVPGFDGGEQENTTSGVSDDSQWDEINAVDTVTVGRDNPLPVGENVDDENADDWDTIDEVDDAIGGVDQDQINAVRDQMAGQANADASRIHANASNDFARIEADREEKRRRAAQARAEFAAAMQGLANELNDAYQNANQPTYTPPNRSSGYSSSRGPSSGGMSQDAYTGALKKCIAAKYAKARRAGFPIMDPNGPRIECMSEIRSGRVGSSSSSSSLSSLSSSSSAGGGDQCKAVAKGSKNPRRWEACCRKGGEIRYNAFTVPDGSRTGMSAYRCMQKGRPDEPKYMIKIK